MPEEPKKFRYMGMMRVVATAAHLLPQKIKAPAGISKSFGEYIRIRLAHIIICLT